MPANDSLLHSLQISSSLKQSARIPISISEQNVSSSLKKTTKLELVKEELYSPKSNDAMEEDVNIDHAQAAILASSYSSVLRVLTGNTNINTITSSSLKDDSLLNQQFSSIDFDSKIKSPKVNQSMKTEKSPASSSKYKKGTESSNINQSKQESFTKQNNFDSNSDVDDNNNNEDEDDDDLQFKLS